MLDETITITVDAGGGNPPEALEVPRRIGTVKLGDLLGEGGGGAVFVGFDEALGRRVAVKLLHRRADGTTSELVHGVRAAAKIKHPNVITIYHVDTVCDMPMIVMEYIDGISLRDLIKRSGPLELPLALFVMRSIAAAAAALHAVDVVHRDLKPANTLFDREGEVHVCDFGLACAFDVARFRGEAGNIGGSPLYMAPEMFDGHVSPHSDVYALGVMLFELLCGRPPFSAETISELKAMHLAARVPIEWLERKGIPEDVYEIVRRALNKNRILRYKTSAHMLRALQTIQPPGSQDETLRAQIARIVTAGQDDKSPDADATPPSTAQTTFDLVARRAEEKRRRRGDTPSSG